MQIPAAMFIESAQDALQKLKKADSPVLNDELAELNEALGECSEDKKDGYLLGLQVARAVIATNTMLIVKGVKPEDVL